MRKRRHNRESIVVKRDLRFQIAHPKYRYELIYWGWLGLRSFGRSKLFSYEDSIKATGAWRDKIARKYSRRKWNHIKERSLFIFGFFFSWKSKEVGLGGGIF